MMYERSAIVLERYFEKVFGFNKENNLKTNYENYRKIIEKIKGYQKVISEEEKVINKFDEVATEIEDIQNKQSNIYNSNIELENQRNKLFNDLAENPNTLDNKLQKIEQKIENNNEELKKLREKYVKAIVIFTERQKERKKYSRIRRTAEEDYMNYIDSAQKEFEDINKKDVEVIRRFIDTDKQKTKQEIINIMIKNGENERVPFIRNVIERAVEARFDIAEKEAELYINIFDRSKRILNEINNEDIKLAKAEKLLRDVSVKLSFLNINKEYIVGFLDNERMTAINGKKTHEKLMEEACKNFDEDLIQIRNLYELIIKETTGKSTKKAYKELYNKNYLREIKEKEKDFEEEVTNIKINVGTVINSNYWRIEGIKNIYQVFQEEITEKFNKDLSEFRIEEIEDLILPGNEIESDDENYEEYEDTEELNDYDEYNDNEELNNYEEYDDTEELNDYEENYDYENDNDYHEEIDENEEYNNQNNDEEKLTEDQLDEIIKNSRKKASIKNEKNISKGLFGKLFKK